MLHIFLVEDDTTLRKGLTELMEREGYQVTAAASGSEARSHADALARADAILLDIMLPDVDGIQLCREWRKQGKVTPILFLTALDEEATVVQGLDAGGDDYVTKPFRTQELLGRVRALLRRHPATSYELGDLKVDLDTLSVSRGGQSDTYRIPFNGRAAACAGARADTRTAFAGHLGRGRHLCRREHVIGAHQPPA